MLRVFTMTWLMFLIAGCGHMDTASVQGDIPDEQIDPAHSRYAADVTKYDFSKLSQIECERLSDEEANKGKGADFLNALHSEIDDAYTRMNTLNEDDPHLLSAAIKYYKMLKACEDHALEKSERDAEQKSSDSTDHDYESIDDYFHGN